jgi:hypothetical protein
VQEEEKLMDSDHVRWKRKEASGSPQGIPLRRLKWTGMIAVLSSVLFGRDRSGYYRALVIGCILGLFGVTFAGYALGVFAVSGGLVWLPVDAAIVGVLAGCGAGYYRAGLVVGCGATYASLLGYHANHAFFGLSRRPLVERAAYFVRVDGLVFLAVEAIVLGTLAFAFGWLLRWGVDALSGGTGLSSGGG